MWLHHKTQNYIHCSVSTQQDRMCLPGQLSRRRWTGSLTVKPMTVGIQHGRAGGDLARHNLESWLMAKFPTRAASLLAVFYHLLYYINLVRFTLYSHAWDPEFSFLHLTNCIGKLGYSAQTTLGKPGEHLCSHPMPALTQPCTWVTLTYGSWEPPCLTAIILHGVSSIHCRFKICYNKNNKCSPRTDYAMSDKEMFLIVPHEPTILVGKSD